jgi:hypothetical protein
LGEPLKRNVMHSKVMPFFSIGYPDKERLEITLVGAPSDPKVEGYDWIKGQVRIEVGTFKGELEIHLCVSDIIRFKEQLEPVYERLEGVAEFKTIEDQLSIRVEVDKLGHVQVSGHLLDDFVAGNKLDFNISYDQTLLWHTISEMDEALFQLFPQRHNKRLERTRHEQASLLSCVGEPLKRNVRRTGSGSWR